MRIVLQRVVRAVVRVDGEVVGSIERGVVALVGVGTGDGPAAADAAADKLLGMRIFEDAEGMTNLSIEQVRGAFLVVSQFTLQAALARGRRPSFTRAARPDLAEPLVERLVDRLRAAGVPVSTGRFGAMMQVELVNDGPFTLVLDVDGAGRVVDGGVGY
jgi:D-tyrosyl-tRNA(Tyr) deacylase